MMTSCPFRNVIMSLGLNSEVKSTCEVIMGLEDHASVQRTVTRAKREDEGFRTGVGSGSGKENKANSEIRSLA